MAKSSGSFRFRKHDSIGANDAEDDETFLATCFEDTGDLDALLDCQNPKRIVLGRTGAGKTALLLELRKRTEFVIPLSPEHLSFNYLTNSTILKYLDELGIGLDPFFKLLWRHVFAVSIIQDRFGIVDEESMKSKLSQMMELFESKEVKAKKRRQTERRAKAIEYLNRWGDRFFEDVEHRTVEVVNRFEEEVLREVKAATSIDIGSTLKCGKLGASAGLATNRSNAEKIGVDEKAEIINRAQTVINSIQVQELTGIVELVDEILDDPQKPCYIVIDKLDEQWADDAIRRRLLKGLVDTVKEFGKVHNAKIIICLRIDLLEQLFRETRSEAGFQEDKYRSLFLPLKWSREQLQELLDRRVTSLICDRYTSYKPTLSDVMPKRMTLGRRKREPTIDFLLTRTWNRPRDIIEFFNVCIRKSEGKPQLSKTTILEAEGEYSRTRLRAIAQEWHGVYPHLIECVKIFLQQRESTFALGDIADESVDEWAVNLACGETNETGRLHVIATEFVNQRMAVQEVRQELASVFFRTGCVGLKASTFTQIRWADSESYSVSTAEVGDDTGVYVHPGLWRVLGISNESKSTNT